VQHWSHRTQQTRLNNVGLSPISAGGWFLSVKNNAGGLEFWHNGWEGLNYSWIHVWPDRRIAIVGMTNSSSGRALDWARDQLIDSGRLVTDFGVPAATFPYPEAVTRLPSGVAGSSSSNISGDEADKAFDGNYDTYWAAQDWDGYAAWLQVTVPVQPFVGHVLINENGPFPKKYFDPDFGQEFPILSRGGGGTAAFKVTSYELYLIDSTDTEWLAAKGTTLGVNKLIPVNGYNVKGARLVMYTAFGGPVIKEMHLLPW